MLPPELHLHAMCCCSRFPGHSGYSQGPAQQALLEPVAREQATKLPSGKTSCPLGSWPWEDLNLFLLSRFLPTGLGQRRGWVYRESWRGRGGPLYPGQGSELGGRGSCYLLRDQKPPRCPAAVDPAWLHLNARYFSFHASCPPLFLPHRLQPSLGHCQSGVRTACPLGNPLLCP